MYTIPVFSGAVGLAFESPQAHQKFKGGDRIARFVLPPLFYPAKKCHSIEKSRSIQQQQCFVPLDGDDEYSQSENTSDCVEPC